MDGGLKFLVVDDSVDDVTLLRSALDPRVDITPLESGTKALTFLSTMQHCPFDLVVIDWRLPGVGGDHVAKEFLSSPMIQRQVPVVVLSSALPPALNDDLRGRGALILEKPLDLEGYERLAAGLCDLAATSSRSKSTATVAN